MRTVLLLLGLAIGYSSTVVAETAIPELERPTAVEVEVLHVGDLPTDGSNIYDSYRGSAVLVNQQQYIDRLPAYLQQRSPPDIDFERNRVLFVHMGRRNNIGPGIEVGPVRADEDSVTVKVTLRYRGPYCVGPPGYTSPFVFVRIGTTKEVVVDEEAVVSAVSCDPPPAMGGGL